MNKFNVVFGKNAIEASKWAETFAEKVGRSKYRVKEWMASVQDLFVPLGFARDEATELSKSLVKLAVDVGSFQNKADADVIRSFTSALVGNHDAVRNYGIVISETALSQEVLNQNLGKAYKDLTDLEKVQLRYSLLLKGSTDAIGDAERTANSYASQVKRLNSNLHDTAVELGDDFLGAMTKVVRSINENKDTWGWFIETLGEGLAEIASGFKELRETINDFQPVYDNWLRQQEKQKRIARPAPGAFGGFGAGTMGAPPIGATEKQLPVGRLEISPRGYQRLAEMRARLKEMEEEAKRNAFIGPPKPLERDIKRQIQKEVELSIEAQHKIYEDAREQIERVRHMDYLTRQEKIQNLKDYQQAHAETLSKVEEAEKALHEEILAYQHSRADAMEAYFTQMRENYQDFNLYLSEKFADTAMSIEDSMANAFDSMISEGESFKDAMTDFARDVGRAFSRMAAEMAAQLAMLAIMQGFGGLFRTPNLSLTGPTNAGVPPALGMGGVLERGRIMPMASGAVLDRPTYFPMANGDIGLAGEAGPELGFFPLKRQGGKLGIEASGQQPINVQPTPVKVVFVRNHREATIEAMRGEEGQAVIINTLRDNGIL